MNITELLITGYNIDTPVFAITLAPDGATVVLMAPDGPGETAVGLIANRGTKVFAGTRELLETLTLTPLQTEPRS